MLTGYLLAALVAIPLGFLIGMSNLSYRMLDPAIQILRPISPLAWLPLGLVLFKQSEPAALSTPGAIATAASFQWPFAISERALDSEVAASCAVTTAAIKTVVMMPNSVLRMNASEKLRSRI